MSNDSAASLLAGLIYLALGILFFVAFWRIFVKAGQPGWAAIIPFYNLYILCKIVGKPGWWLLLLCIPIVNVVVSLILYIDLSKSFGKGSGFGIGLWLLPIVFFPILAFGDAQYQRPLTTSAEAAAPA